MKKYFIVQWFGGDRYYVKKTYCGRIVLSSNKSDAKKFDEKTAQKYILKLQSIDALNELQIRQLA